MTIAVIIPVLNSSKLLGETLLALRSSTRVPDELIIVDDASTDGSARVAEQFGARVVVMPQNLGPAACRNRAALLAQSEILMFLDADTCIHPETLERIELHLLSDAALTAVFGSYDDTPRDPGNLLAISQSGALLCTSICKSHGPNVLEWMRRGAARILF